MRAVVFDGQASLRREYPIPKPGPDDALVAVRLAGVCKTDLEILKGYMGFRGVMGHEFVGTVVEGPRAWKDKRVVGEINCICGRCEMCRAGLGNHCLDRTVLGIAGHDGVFAEYVAMPVANLHQVPDNVSDEQAVLVEPLAAAFEILRQVKLQRDQDVVVLGDGRLGQLIVRVLKTVARRVVLVGKHAWKLEAAEKQGIQTALVSDFVPRGRTPVVIDATGTPSGFDLAMRTVRPRGTIVLKSTFAGGDGLNLAPLVINEITVIGSRCGPFRDALAALAAGQVDVSSLIGKRFPLDDALDALAVAARGDSLKVILEVAR